MTDTLISLEDAANRLRVRPAYVRELVNKGRLHLTHDQQLVATEVDKLAQLLNKLRSEGIATLVDITAKNTGKTH